MFARLSLLFASAGLFIASYLTATYYSGVLVPCGPQGGCSDALYNPAYHIKGVPLAAFGTAYCLLVVGAVLYLTWRPSLSGRSGYFTLLALGFFTSLLLNVHLSSVGVTCNWCLAFLCTLLGCFIIGASKLKIEHWSKFQRLTAALLSVGVLSVGLILGSKSRDVDELDPRLLAQHANEMISLDSPRVGRPGRSVVLFGEVACPSCRIAMNKLLPYAEQGKIQLVIRHLRIESHPISREACALAQLAYKGHKLPELMRAVNGRIISSRAELQEIAKLLNLPDPSAGGTEQVEKDSQFAKQLGVTGAPTLIWIDGNRLPQHLSLSEIEARLNQ